MGFSQSKGSNVFFGTVGILHSGHSADFEVLVEIRLIGVKIS
jgi:hypothetical protein